jgi:metal-responsive CopG/Arc/MetJ family transcriptional regulator
MKDRHDVTVPMEQSLVDDIDGELTYGDSRSEWIRNAIREKLAREQADAETDGGETLSAA